MQPLTPPEGWEVNETDGSSKVSLTKDYGEEVVQVDFTARQYVSLFRSVHHVSSSPSALHVH